MYIDAQMSPMLSGLATASERDSRQPGRRAHISSLDCLRRSRPLRPALTKAGPRAGTRNNVERNARMAKPRDALSAARGK